MKTRFFLLAILALSLVTLQPVTAFAQESEFQGKKTSEWLKILHDGKEVNRRRAAVFALDALGPNTPGVLPGLIEAMEKDADAGIRSEIALSLGGHGEKAKGAVDALAGRLEDENAKVREAAARSLGKLAEHASIHVMGLGRALKDKDADARAAAAEALIYFGDKTKIILPQIIAAAQDGKLDVYTRLYSVQILGKQAGDDANVIDVLGKILAAAKDSPVNLRQAAATSLGTIGPAAHGTTSILAAALDDAKQDKDLRLARAVALGKIGSKASAAWPAVKRLFSSSDAGLRCQAVRLTPVLAKGNPEADKELLAIIDNEDNIEVLVAAVQEVGELEVKAAVPVLERLAMDTLRPAVRQAAMASLKKINKGS